MFASSTTFSGFCNGFASLQYFSFEPGENRHCGGSFSVKDMIDTTGAIDVSQMFSSSSRYVEYDDEEGYSKDVGIFLNLFDTSNVSNFESMFHNCESPYINLSNKSPYKEDNSIFKGFKDAFSDNKEDNNLFSFESATNMKYMFEDAGYSRSKVSLQELSISIVMPSVVIFPDNNKCPTKPCDASSMFRTSHFREIIMNNMKFNTVTNFESMFLFAISFSFELSLSQDSRKFEDVSNLVSAVENNDESKMQDVITYLYENQQDLESLITSGKSKVRSRFGTNINFNINED